MMLIDSPFVIPPRTKGAASLSVAAVNSLGSMRFGADYVCDGAADDVQIQAALDALPAQGGKVWCAAGDYVFTGPLKIPSNTTLEFEVGNTIKVAASGTHTLDAAGNKYLKAAAVTFSALIVNDDPGDAGSGNTNIHIIGADIDFESPASARKFAEDISYAGIWLDQCTDSSIERCKVSNVVFDCDSGITEAFGILLTDCDYSVVRDCEANGNGYEGIGFRGGCTYCLLERCYGTGNGVHLFQAAVLPGGNGDAPQYVTFLDCFSTDLTVDSDNMIFHGLDTTNDGIGLMMDGCYAPSLHVYGHLKNVQVTNCHARYITLQTSQASQVINGVTITNNHFGVLTGAYAKIRLETNVAAASTIENVHISGNYITLGTADYALNVSGTTAGQAGIIKNVSFVGNHINADAIISSGTVALIVNNQTGHWSNFQINDNQLWGDDAYTYLCWIQCLGAGSSGNISRVQVNNNLCANSTRCLVTFGSQATGTGSVFDVQIHNNLAAVVNTYSVVRFGGCNVTDVSLIGNKVLTCKYVLEQTGGTVTGVTLANNVVDSITTSFSTGTIGDLKVYPGNVGIDDQTITADAQALNVWGTSSLNSDSNKVDSTLADGQFIGQVKTIVMTNADNSSTVTIAHHATSDPEVATFDAVGETGVFLWNGTDWITIFATCTF